MRWFKRLFGGIPHIHMMVGDSITIVCPGCGGRFTLYATRPRTIVPICPCGEAWETKTKVGFSC